MRSEDNLLAAAVESFVEQLCGPEEDPGTDKVGRFRHTGGVPINCERRGVRWVNVWLPHKDVAGGWPDYVEHYPPSRDRNWQLSPDLRTGTAVVRVKVTFERMQESFGLIREALNSNA